jgi:hypothetical protein
MFFAINSQAQRYLQQQLQANSGFHCIMATQAEVFQRIQSKMEKRGGIIPRKAEITKLLQPLYDTNLKGERFFYSQDQAGLPVERIPTTANGETFYCTITDTNLLDASSWKHQRRPYGFIGRQWPPKSITDLLSTPDKSERCAVCDRENVACKCDYEKFQRYVHDNGIANVALRTTTRLGIGGFARKTIPKETCIAEFTGRIVPADAIHDNDYHTGIPIGKLNGTKEGQARAYIDCERTGSIARFFNHSCDPNAQFLVGRCGMKHRIVYVETIKKIEEGDEITVDYKDGRFKDGLGCLCGTAKCEYTSKIGNKRKEREESRTGENYPSNVEAGPPRKKMKHLGKR